AAPRPQPRTPARRSGASCPIRWEPAPAHAGQSASPWRSRPAVRAGSPAARRRSAAGGLARNEDRGQCLGLGLEIPPLGQTQIQIQLQSDTLRHALRHGTRHTPPPLPSRDVSFLRNVTVLLRFFSL